MKRLAKPTIGGKSRVLVPGDTLDELLEAIWEWAFADYRATPPTDRKNHLFHNIVCLDSVLHGLTVEESWSRIEAWQKEQQNGPVPKTEER